MEALYKFKVPVPKMSSVLPYLVLEIRHSLVSEWLK